MSRDEPRGAEMSPACIRFSGEMPPRFSSAKKGGCPVAMWTSSPPKDQTSHGLPYRSCRSTSGAM